MNLMSYIVERALILIPALNVLGLIFKSIERIPDKFIPLLLLIFGISGSIALTGLSADSVIQGVLVTGAAVYGNQVVKQLKRIIDFKRGCKTCVLQPRIYVKSAQLSEHFFDKVVCQPVKSTEVHFAYIAIFKLVVYVLCLFKYVNAFQQQRFNVFFIEAQLAVIFTQNILSQYLSAEYALCP